MQRWWILAAVLGLAPAAPGEEPRLAVLVKAEQTAAAMEAMQKELAALFGQAGVGLEFQMTRASNDVGRAAAVAVVEVRDGQERPAEAGELGRLGWITRVDGVFQPMIVVDAAQVAQFVAKVYHPHERALNGQALGVALARVVTHELLHYFTGRAEHGTSRLFSGAVSPYTLIEPGVGLEPEEAREVREGMARRAGVY
jgi:hypothetical protein